MRFDMVGRKAYKFTGVWSVEVVAATTDGSSINNSIDAVNEEAARKESEAQEKTAEASQQHNC